MQEFSKTFRYNLIHARLLFCQKLQEKCLNKGTVWTLGTPILFDLWQYSVHRQNAISEQKMVKSRRLENALLAIQKFQISIKGRCNICKGCQSKMSLFQMTKVYKMAKIAGILSL